MKKTLSIITVCFNSAETIEKCLKSVISQLTDEVEYLIIDGKSEDNTVEIIKNNLIANMRLISEEDKGIYDAMNKGIMNAQGEWVWFINSDDYIKPGLISDVLKCISENQTFHCIYGDLDYVRTVNGQHLLQVKKAPESLSSLKNDMIIGHPSVICKRKAMVEIGMFDLFFKVAADWDLLLRLYNKGYSFVYIDKVLSRFYSGGSSSKSHIAERHLVRKKNESYYIVDLFYVKDCIKYLILFFIRPLAKKWFIKNLKKI